MQYLGGKSAIAKELAEVIINHSLTFFGGGSSTFVSLFCGACSVESKIGGYGYFDKMIINDKNEYLIALLNAAKGGYQPPEIVTPEEYKRVRLNKDVDKALTGFIGFACSFGGKWFGGYAKNSVGTNYALRGKKSLLKDMSTLMTAEFICNDYQNVNLPEKCVIYLDPPYNNTTGYNRELFDTDKFWDYVREISKQHLVFISEQTAPDDFISIWNKSKRRTLDVNKSKQFWKTEKLFVYKSIYEKLRKIRENDRGTNRNEL